MSTLVQRALAAASRQAIKQMNYPPFIRAMLKNNWRQAYQLAQQPCDAPRKLKPSIAIRLCLLADSLLKAHLEANPTEIIRCRQRVCALSQLLESFRLDAHQSLKGDAETQEKQEKQKMRRSVLTDAQNRQEEYQHQCGVLI